MELEIKRSYKDNPIKEIEDGYRWKLKRQQNKFVGNDHCKIYMYIDTNYSAEDLRLLAQACSRMANSLEGNHS